MFHLRVFLSNLDFICPILVEFNRLGTLVLEGKFYPSSSILVEVDNLEPTVLESLSHPKELPVWIKR